jgi:ribonuclease D
MSSDLPAPTLIEEQGALDELLELLEGEDEIAVDTEADSFFSYREKVCLIQVTAASRDFLVDPLAGLDLSGLGPILADPSKIKIFHDGEYDVLIMQREYGFKFAGLFDTRIAAAALGSEAPGLASVLEAHFGVQLDKSMQRSNWGERPLSERQIDYARLDTHYLHRLMDEQRVELERVGRMEILDGECRRLEGLVATPIEFNPDEWVRLKGARTLSPESRQATRELVKLRDELASKADTPLFRVMNNQALLTIAAERPTTSQELADIQGISWRQVRKMGEQILAALERARELGPLKQLPKLAPKDGTGGLDPYEVELYDRLKSWRRDRADAEGLDASLVLNRHALVKLAKDGPRTREALAEIDGLVEWQVERFGKQLLEVLRDFACDRAAGRIEIGRRRGKPRRQ